MSTGGQERSDSGIGSGGQERSDPGIDSGGQERSDPGINSGGVVVVDKPGGITSHDVVGRCRRLLGTRRVGHAGTLDPMATGVLVVGVGRATKILGLLAAADKSYAATIRLGQSTSTDDAEGEVLQTVPTGDVTDDRIVEAIGAFRGAIEQVPSAFSAVKVKGQRAYRLARAGKSVDLAPRRVQIDRFDVLSIDRRDGLVDVTVEIDCSTGTYIRALARDLGSALGVGGHLVALRRTRVGGFGLEQARTVDSLAGDQRLSYSLDDACLRVFSVRHLTAAEAEHARHGRPLEPGGIAGNYAAVAPDGHVIAVLRDEPAKTKSVVVLRPATL